MADQGEEGLLSPYLRSVRIDKVVPYIKGRVLDVGCGSGRLAFHVSEENYVGFDIDQDSLRTARTMFPNYRFISELTDDIGYFDTIVALAVIEHISNPALFLSNIASFLTNKSWSRIILTTPHPFISSLHEIGARIGLFSRHAGEEHEELLDRSKLELVGKYANLNLCIYGRFLFKANQIAIYSKRMV